MTWTKAWAAMCLYEWLLGVEGGMLQPAIDHGVCGVGWLLSAIAREQRVGAQWSNVRVLDMDTYHVMI